MTMSSLSTEILWESNNKGTKQWQYHTNIAKLLIIDVLFL